MPFLSDAAPFLIAASVPFVMVASLMPWLIRQLQRLTCGQSIREDGPQSHFVKQGTPTGGGVLVLLALVLVWGVIALLSPQLAFQPAFAWSLALTLALGGLGLWDDALKLLKQHNKGLGARAKLVVQALLGLALGCLQLFILKDSELNLLGWTLDIGWWHLPFSMLAVVGASNAVNVTDGLDGLAGSALVVSFSTLLLFFATLLPLTLGTPLFWQLPAGGLFCIAAVSALFGFLLYNHHKARIFMGDSGSLALGGGLVALALICNLDVWFLCFGFLYVVEATSVLLQIASFKLTGRRIFKMAPLHHHFELCGLKETQVVRLFVGCQLLVSLVGFWYFRSGFVVPQL